jgi:hypothetical protein
MNDMRRRDRLFPYHLDPKGIGHLPFEEVKAILRGADAMILSGGRTLLTKVLRGSRGKDVLEHQLDKCPVYGYYRDVPADVVLAKIDRVILDRYLCIEYESRLPVLVYTDAGWEIEKEARAVEFLQQFDRLLETTEPPYDMSFLKDRNRGMIFLLLDKVENTRSPKYIPLLKAWAQIDYRKVQQRIWQVINTLTPKPDLQPPGF